MNSEINEKLKTLPDKSGVYIMHGSDDEIIYVGKAKNLKNRVRSYFKSHKHPPKVASMVSRVEYFEYIITDSELEALVLENNLIKQNMPKYNILLKDDKTYPFMKITVNEPFPRIYLTRRVKDDGAKYFGPYQSSYDLKQLIALIKDIFSLRSCSNDFPENPIPTRPCLYYQLGKCKGVCTGNVLAEEYRAVISRVIDFVSGKTSDIVEQLGNEMMSASRSLDFEKAAQCRDRLKAIDALGERQKIVNPNGNDADAICVYNNNNVACIQMFFIRSGKIIGREHYYINDTFEISDSEILSDFVRQYYETSSFIPNRIQIECEIEDSEAIAQWLTEKAGRKVTVHVPKIGDGAKLIRMIKANAKKEHSERELKMLRDINFKNNALNELEKLLDIGKAPMLIEAYDISNMGNNSSVAAMVCFKDGKPYRKGYRNFKIKTVLQQDDYASMREAIGRRFAHAAKETEDIKNGVMKAEDAKFLPLPDVVFADGGETHRAAAAEAMSAAGFDVPVFGIVKDDNHRTRGLVSQNGEIPIDTHSDAFMLLTSIQDEMHKRAITYLRNTQNKKTAFSELDNIAGVGDQRKKKLLSHFKSLKKISEAGADDIAAVSGIDKKTAQNIYNYFHDDRKDG